MKVKYFMKKLMIFLLCIMLIGQSIEVYALETDCVLEQPQIKNRVGENEQIIEGEQFEEDEQITAEETIEEGEQITEEQSKEGEQITEKEQPEDEQITEDEQISEEEQPKEGEQITEKEQPENEHIEDGEQVIDEEQSENRNSTSDNKDPQYGRENGYLDKGFGGIALYSDVEGGYIHSSKFADYIINDVIDVSQYQGNIDWIKVRQSGINYAFIRAGFRGYGTSGSLNVDKNFKTNMEQALSAGIQVGVYFFSQAITKEEAVDEAEYVLDLIEGYKISLPVVIDFEYASSNEGLIGRLYNANLTKEEATEICIQFCDIVENSGYSAMVYANKDMLQNGLNASQITENHEIWLANYTTSTTYAGEYSFWQYTQNGVVDGISERVDKSFWYKRNESIYNGVDYASVYNFNYYIEKYVDIKEAFGDDEKAALEHFVNQGMSEGRQGNENFNVHTYRNRYSDLRYAYGKNLKPYYMHYISYGEDEGRSGSGVSELVNPITIYNEIDYAPVYDFEYYIEKYVDIKEVFGEDDIAALEHFVNQGMSEGRQGNARFNVYTYKNRYSDLRREFGMDLKAYYIYHIDFGEKEGRDGTGTSELLNPMTIYNGVDYRLIYNFNYYTGKYVDIKEAFGDDEKAALEHFVNQGMLEGRQGNESFNVYTYRNRYSDLRYAYGKNLKEYYIHYMNYGEGEGRSGAGASEVSKPITIYNGVDYASVYDFNYYTEKYTDIKKAFGDDDIAVLEHFVNWGMSEGRQGCENFNVYTYRNRYLDLKNAYGNDLKAYYMHYIGYGKTENRDAMNIGEMVYCCILSGSKEEMTVSFSIELEDVALKNNEYYVVQTDLCNGKIKKSWTIEEGSEGISTVNIAISGEEQIKESLLDEFSLAKKDENGNLKISSNSISISNPEALAQNTAPIFKGTAKKGLQGVYYASDSKSPEPADARYTNTKQTLINLDLSTVVSKTPKSGYISYSYKGNTYYFSDLEDLKTNIKSLNFGYKQYLYGNSGRTPVAVSLCLLLKYNEENSFLIDPAARTYIKDKYYTLNVREEYARETLEALFFYLGETFGQEDCYVSNWILGNEINSSKAWNYSGSLDFDTYMECYATAFRMLYTAVKSEKTGNTVSISLDNGWTAAPDTYAGKVTLDTFAKRIHAQNPNIDWSIAYHPYSYPLTRGDFWNDYSNTTDNISTPYISMRNINVLTNYAGTLESTYGKKSGSIRILLTEQGYSYAAGKEVQAQAIARGYYIAEFNDRIDAFIIRAIVDDEDEAKGKLYFGLMNSQQDKRISYYVYEHMDSDLSRLAQQSAEGYVTRENYTNFNSAKSILCNTNWNAIVPGFNASKLAGIK